MDKIAEERERALDLTALAMIEQNPDQIEAAKWAWNDYFLDHCPESDKWEEFDADGDAARQSLYDLFD